MNKIGKKYPDDYYFEPVSVSLNAAQEEAGIFYVDAYNELYILLHPQKYYGLLIYADNSLYDCDNTERKGVPEFTGRIWFKKTGDVWSLDMTTVGGSPATGGGDGKAGGDEGEPASTGVQRYGTVEFLRVVIY